MNDVSTLPLPTIRARTLGSIPVTFDFRGVLLFSKPGIDDGWTAPWTATQKDLTKASSRDVVIFGMQCNLPAEIESIDIALECEGRTIPLTLFNTGREAVFAICSWWDGEIARVGTLADYYRFTCPFLPIGSFPTIRSGFLLADHLVIDDTVESAAFADLYFSSMGVNIACLSSLTGNPSINAPFMSIHRGFKLGWQCRQGQDDIPPMGSATTPETWASNLVQSFRTAKWPLDKIALVIVCDEPALYTTDPADADRLAAHMAHCMAALRALIGPDCLLAYNANNASLRSYAPPTNSEDPASLGQVAIDPFVFAKLTANDPNVILWSEDWLPDEGSSLITWPFFSSVAQSAGKKWGGYIVGQTAGDHYGDRIRSMMERGATVCFNYNAGPDFVRVNDSYWSKRESVWGQVRSVWA